MEGPVLWGKGGRTWWRERTEVAIVVPSHIRRSGGRKLILVWGLGSGGWLEIEERGLIGVDGIEVGSSRCAMFLSLVWLDGMNVCRCIAKGLVEFDVLGNVVGKHVGSRVDPQKAWQIGLPQLWGKAMAKGRS